MLILQSCAFRVLTIHNNPEGMSVDRHVKHLQLQLADVMTEDISQFFDTSYEFIEDARADEHGPY